MLLKSWVSKNERRAAATARLSFCSGVEKMYTPCYDEEEAVGAVEDKREKRLTLWGMAALYLAFMIPFGMNSLAAGLGVIIFPILGIPMTIGFWLLYFPVRFLVKILVAKERRMVERVAAATVLAAGVAAYLGILVMPQADFSFSPVYPAVREQLAYMPQIEAYWAEHREELEVEAEQSGMEHWPRGRPLGHGEDPGRLLMLDMDLVGGTNTHASVSLVRYSAPHGLEGPWQVGRTNYEAPLDETWTVLIEYYPPG